MKKRNKKQIIYLVGDSGPEHNSVRSAHKSYVNAVKDWNKLRLELLNEAKESLKETNKFSKKMYREIVKNLSCKIPNKIDNYPHETPYIFEIELKN